MGNKHAALDEILIVELEELDWDFSRTKSFNDAVAKAKEDIAKSFEEALAAADSARVAVKVKEPEPA